MSAYNLYEKNKVKLKMKLSKGWKVKAIKVYQGKRRKNITKKDVCYKAKEEV